MGYKKIKIHTVGDSHAWHCWLHIPGVIVDHGRPMTMYRAGLSRVDFIKDVDPEALTIFCWGEIDCRCHIYKFPPYHETMNKVIENYRDTLAISAKTHKNIWLFNIVPPMRKDGPISQNKNFPFLGTDEERLGFVTYMNDKLRGLGYPFIDIHKYYADKDGFMKLEMSDHHVHIKDPGPLMTHLDLMLADHGWERDV